MNRKINTDAGMERKKAVKKLYHDEIKREIIRIGDESAGFVREIGSAIWEFAETARTEYRSARFLCNRLEGIGFSVERGVAGFPTGFLAEFHNGEGPAIGLICEYDALPGLSSVEPGAPGHGCGHNLYAAGALGTALILKTVMEKENTPGSVLVFGTPSEEKGGAKQFYARQGLFSRADVLFSLHSHALSGVFFRSHNAIISKKYRFYGTPAHAGSMPERGRSALDALELMNIGVQFLREHVTPDVRIHYIITGGGRAANVVPDFAESEFVLRAQDLTYLKDVERRVDLIADGAATMTETKTENEFLMQYANSILNRTLCEIAYQNLLLVGPANFDEEDQARAKELGFAGGIAQDITPIPPLPGFHGGSTDEADASWFAPMARVCLRTMPGETPNHTVVRCQQANLPAAYKGMTKTCEAVACTAFDLLTDPEKLAAVRKTWLETKGDRIYPTDGQNWPAPASFPDAAGVHKTAPDALSVCLDETILLSGETDVTVHIDRGDERIGSILCERPDKTYEARLSSPIEEGEALTLRYQKKGQEKETLLGYLTHAL